jgi:SPRY domain
MADVIVGTDSDTYTPAPGDVGKNIYCRVTATNAVGSATANSNTVGPVAGISATTFDPAHTAADLTLSGGNLTATHTTAARGCTRSITTGSGKKYFELFVTAVDNAASTVIGIANAAMALSSFPGLDLDGYGMAFDGQVYSGGVSVANLALGIVAGDRICVAVDFTAEKIWFRKNGDAWNPALTTELHDPTDPLTGFNFSATNAGPYYACLALRQIPDACTINFGATAYTHTVPAGYGNF